MEFLSDLYWDHCCFHSNWAVGHHLTPHGSFMLYIFQLIGTVD